MSLNPTIISSLTSLGEILKQYCLDTIDKKNKKLIDEYVQANPSTDNSQIFQTIIKNSKYVYAYSVNT